MGRSEHRTVTLAYARMNYQLYTSTCEQDTFRLGVDLASDLRPGDTVAFYGDLGSGKTEFIKGICARLKVEDLVSSPTFTIVNQYTGTDSGLREIPIYHIDLYRIESEKELDDIGMCEVLADTHAIKLVEWSEHEFGTLPNTRYEIRFAQLDEEDYRRIEVLRVGEEALAMKEGERALS